MSSSTCEFAFAFLLVLILARSLIASFSPSPAAAAKGKVARCYSGPLTSQAVTSMIKCDPHGPLVIHVAKLYAESDGQSFAAFGRIYSGTVKPGELQNFLPVKIHSYLLESS